MKRLHIHVSVDRLDRSVRFYSALFGSEPIVLKPDYAKWMLDDPRVNFAISAGRHAQSGVAHLGIQAESEAELGQVYGRLRAAGGAVLEESDTICCYAKSEKKWIDDPDRLAWETFLTKGEAAVYGDGPPLSFRAGEVPCCAPKSE